MANELLADVVGRSLGMIQMTIADFSDAEMFVRPCPAANHAAWQLGHLIGSEVWMISQCTPGAAGELPAGFAEKFKKENSKNDNPQDFPTKAQLLEQFAKIRTNTINWVKSLSAADLAKPGPEPMRSMCPTVGHIAHLLPQHVAMHVGQFQGIRRKLGKPVLF